MTDKCGAKTRSGNPCEKPPTPGRKRCHMHGGAAGNGAPLGSQNALKHGIYSAHLTDEEREGFDSVALGTVDAELRLARIRLARALKAEAEAQNQPELDEVVSQAQDGDNPSHSVTRKSRVRDYNAIIDRLMGRIQQLELARKSLESGAGDDEAQPMAHTFTFEVIDGRA